ncbi:hypothetical protein [Streptomyces sp. NPDC087862]|uniref:hypothetical protein n=1 Tax=Streptomyces sp. NPDC087862 TaxID=3365813 RepID=UPI0038134102
MPESPCDAITGAAKEICLSGQKSGGGTGGGSRGVDSGALDQDPLHALARSVADAANWTAGQLGAVVNGDRAVDFTNSNFLQQYAIVFAASTVLVLVLWLLAISKRAVRGVPMGTAMGEAVGLLWIAVGAAAFTPLILYVLVGAVSAVTTALSSGLGGSSGDLFTAMGASLKAGKIGGGPVIQIIASLVTIALCGALWLLLVLRALALYAGALLGVVVYSGLVDKDLWGHVRRWAAVMLGLVMIEPIIVIVLGLASALEAADDYGTIAAGIVVSGLALGSAIFMILKFPALGDSIRVARGAGRAAGGAARMITGRPGTAGAAVGVQRGISAHGDRGSSRTSNSSSSTPRPANPVAGGMGAHGSRAPKQQPKPKPKQDE